MGVAITGSHLSICIDRIVDNALRRSATFVALRSSFDPLPRRGDAPQERPGAVQCDPYGAEMAYVMA